MTLPHQKPLTAFSDHFSVEFALSPEKLKATKRLRYLVYCEELGYEASDRFPDALETDAYDDQSIHLLIIHKRTGRAAGCARVVTAKQKLEDLPMFGHGTQLDEHEIFHKIDLQPNNLCEISRLAVDPFFRRRKGEKTNNLGENQTYRFDDRRIFPLITQAAFLGCMATTEIFKLNNVFALMEPFLARLLSRSGLVFNQVGEDLELNGRRAPYFTTTEAAAMTMKPELRELYTFICDQLKNSLLLPGHTVAKDRNETPGTILELTQLTRK